MKHSGSHEVRDGAAKGVLDVAHYFFMEYFAIILSCLYLTELFKHKVSRLTYNMKCRYYLLFAFCLHFCLSFRVHFYQQVCYLCILAFLQNYYVQKKNSKKPIRHVCFLCFFWFENWVTNQQLIDWNHSNLNLVNGPSHYKNYSEYCPTACSKMAIHEGTSCLPQSWIF